MRARNAKLLHLRTTVLISVMLAFHCLGHSATHVSGDQTGTWTKARSPYIIDNYINVPSNSTLTIQPGVTVIFPSAYTSMYVYGNLSAQGTSADSIRFKGMADAANSTKYGGALYIYNASAVIKYLSVDSLGDDRAVQGSIIINDVLTPTITNTTIRHSGSADIYAWAGGAKNFSNLNGVVSVVGGWLAADATMNKVSGNSYYSLPNYLNVEEGRTLTIQPGVTVVFPSANTGLYIYGTLNAQGTSSDSIRFRGKADPPSLTKFGGAIYLYSSATLMKYVSIDSLGEQGYVSGAVVIADTITPTIGNTTIRRSGGFDIYTWAGGAKNMSNINGVINIMAGSFSADAIMPKISGNTFYNLLGTVNIDVGRKLTIQPGVTIMFPAPNINLNVYGTLNAQGTSTDSIRFRGKANPDYSSLYGGAIYMNSSSVTLKYVSIDSLGDKNYVQASIVIADTVTPFISNTAVRHTGTTDIYSWAGGAKNLANINGIVNITGGYFSANATMPKVGGNTYYNLLGSVYVDAGRTLTIQPGATLVFPSAYTGLQVYGTLDAQGTAADSIRFKGKADLTNSSRYGGSVYLNSSTANMKYISIDSLGDQNYVQGTVIVGDTFTPSISNTSVNHSGTLDIYTWAGGAKNMSNINGVINITGGYVSADATMPKVGGNTYYNLLGSVYVDAEKTLTIKPGVKVNFPSAYTGLQVYGTLDAQGTAADSIRFKGKADPFYASRYGGDINLYKSTTTIRYLSTDSLGNQVGTIVIADTAAPVIQNTTTRHSGSTDIYSWAGGAKNLANINGIVNITGGYFSANATMPKVGGNTYYNLLGSVYVDAGRTLTIQPGATLVFPSPNTNLDVYGTLNAQGTSADSIRFKGRANPDYTSRYGGAVYLRSSSTTMKYVSMDSLGSQNYGQGAVVITDTATPVIENLSIKNAGSLGLCSWAGGAKNIANIGTPVNVLAGSVTVNATMPKIAGNTYYNLLGSVTVDAGRTLTVKPGVNVVFSSPYAYLNMNGILKANGSISDSVRFKGTWNADYNSYYGGSIYLNADGSSLTFASMDSLGAGSQGALSIYAQSVIKYSTVKNSQNDGIMIQSSKASVSYSTITKNLSGVSVYSDDAIIANCNIISNSNYGLNNVLQYKLIDASSCFWGTASGPYHPVLNPNGTGNRVSDSVKINPWKTSPINSTLPYVASFFPLNAATDSVVNIQGIRFTGASAVRFGGVAAKSFTVLNDSTIKAVVGVGKTGAISVTTSKGVDSLAGFVYCTGVNLQANFAYATFIFDVNTMNSSVDATGYDWSFGDGTVSNETNPVHHYDAPGTYTLCLTDTSACAKRAETVCKIVVVDGLTFTDEDKDGLFDLIEPGQYGTSTNYFDTNNDGLGDGINVFTGLLQLSADTDGDGLSNLQELLNGTSPVLSDTDFDGVSDKLDPFPLDRNRTKLPAKNTADHTAPTILLSERY